MTPGETGSPTGPPAGGPTGPDRVRWAEVLTGIGIVLVVIGHVWRGLIQSRIVTDPDLAHVVDRMIYGFHMPLFFLISGLFLERSITRTDFGPYLLGRARRLLWPLLVWTWLFFTLQALAGDLTNKAPNWDDFPFVPVPPYAHLWFLWALFVLNVAVAAAAPLLRRRRGATLAGLLALATLVYFTGTVIGPLAPYFGGACRSAVFLVLGMILGPRLLDGGDGRLPAPALAGLTAILAGAVWTATTPLAELRGVSLAVAVAASLGLLLLVRDLSGRAGRGARALAFLGVASMAIYLSHTIFTAAVRIGLDAAGVTHPVPHLVLGTATGVAMPLLLLALARRAGFAKVLGF